VTRARLLSLLALLTLALSACMGGAPSAFGDVTLTGVTPDRVTADALTLTITGTRFFQAADGAGMRVEACGVTATATILEPVTRTVVLPPAGKVVVQAGERLTAELPTEGMVAGASDLRVTRPDGDSAVLAGALTCVVATDPEGEEPQDPAEPGEDPENTPPVAQAQDLETAENEALAITLLATDADGDALTFTITSEPEHGTLTGDAPELTFTPDTNWYGEDAFTFTVEDGRGGSDSATVTITVHPLTPASLTITTTPAHLAVHIGVTGPEGFRDDLAGSSRLDGLRHGEYTLTFVPYQEQVEHPLAEDGSFQRGWLPEREELTITLAPGEHQDIELGYEIEPVTLHLAIDGLPDDVLSPLDPLLGATVARFNEDLIGLEPIDPEETMTLEPGVYMINHAPQVRFDRSLPLYAWEEVYDFADSYSHVLTLSSGDETTLTFGYRLVTGNIFLDVTGLPEGLRAEGYLRRWLPGGDWTEPITSFVNLAPGAYYVSGLDVNSSIQAEHPDQGTIPVEIYYEPKDHPGTVVLDSGRNITVPLDYELALGFFRIRISSRDGDPVLGNVRIRPYGAGDDAWVTFSEPVEYPGFIRYDAHPGVYEVRFDDVEPDPPHHDGFKFASGSGYGTVILESYGLNGMGNFKDLEAEYMKMSDW